MTEEEKVAALTGRLDKINDNLGCLYQMVLLWTVVAFAPALFMLLLWFFARYGSR